MDNQFLMEYQRDFLETTINQYWSWHVDLTDTAIQEIYANQIWIPNNRIAQAQTEKVNWKKEGF